MVTDEQKKQYADQVSRSLSRAGIGKLYHAKTLKEYGAAGDMVRTLQADAEAFRGSIAAGEGFIIRGRTEVKSYEFAMVLAKSFHLTQFNTRVLSLVSILDFIRNEYDTSSDVRFENLETVQCIVIPRFYETMDGMPFTRQEFYRVEEFISTRIEDGCSVSVQYSGDLNKNGWWSGYLIENLRTACKEIVL